MTDVRSPLGGRSNEFYSTHVIYSDTGFSKLKNLVTGFCQTRDLWCGDEPEDRIRRGGLKWQPSLKDGSEVSTVVYLTRGEYGLIGSGNVIRVKHLRRWLQESGELRAPLAIKHTFSGIPNVVEIESHNMWPSTGFFTARDLSIWLTERGCKSLLESCDKELLAIYQDASLPYEQRIEQVFQRAGSYLMEADSHAKTLRLSIGNAWDCLGDECCESLITGMSLREMQRVNRETILDCASIGICFTRAIEKAVRGMVLLPFRAFFESNNKYSLSNAERKGPVKRIANFLEGASQGIETGALAYFLKRLTVNSQSSACKCFTDFASTLAGTDYLLGSDQFAEELAEFTNRFRNKVAHHQPFSFAECEQLLRMILEPKKFLSKIALAAQPHAS